MKGLTEVKIIGIKWKKKNIGSSSVVYGEIKTKNKGKEI